MAIQVTKTLFASDWYTGTGSTTISLVDVSEIAINSKNALQVIKKLESKNTQASLDSDKSRNTILDLKDITDTIKIRGWVIDDAAETAWNKAWKLRAMATTGQGALTDLTIENVVFDSSTQGAFLESVTILAKPLKATFNKNLNEIAKAGIARLEVDLAFVIGDAQ